MCFGDWTPPALMLMETGPKHSRRFVLFRPGVGEKSCGVSSQGEKVVSEAKGVGPEAGAAPERS